jgi:hypothetical protein
VAFVNFISQRGLQSHLANQFFPVTRFPEVIGNLLSTDGIRNVTSGCQRSDRGALRTQPCSSPSLAVMRLCVMVEGVIVPGLWHRITLRPNWRPAFVRPLPSPSLAAFRLLGISFFGLALSSRTASPTQRAHLVAQQWRRSWLLRSSWSSILSAPDPADETPSLRTPRNARQNVAVRGNNHSRRTVRDAHVRTMRSTGSIVLAGF